MAHVEIKQPLLDEIKSYLAQATSVMILDYRGLTIEEDTDFRRRMREAGCIYKVYQNAYLREAIKGTPFSCIAPYLEGPRSIAIGKAHSDAVEHVVCGFIPKCPKMEPICSVINGVFYDGYDIVKKVQTDIAKKDLIRNLLGAINMPLVSFRGVLVEILRQKCIESSIDYYELTGATRPSTVSTNTQSEQTNITADDVSAPYENTVSDEPTEEPQKKEPFTTPKESFSIPGTLPKETLSRIDRENLYRSIVNEARSIEILNESKEENNTEVSNSSWEEPKKESNVGKVLMVLMIVAVLVLGLLGVIYEIGTGF